MSLITLLNLMLAFNTLDGAKTTTFFTWFHLQQTSSANGAVTFQPVGARLHSSVKVIVKTDESGVIENSKLELKRSFVDGPQAASARNLAKGFLRQVLSTEDKAESNNVIQNISNFKPGHFESRFPSGTVVTVDDEDGCLVIFAGRTEGPKLGLPFTSYKIKVD